MEGNICLLIRGYNMAEKRDYYEVLGLKTVSYTHLDVYKRQIAGLIIGIVGIVMAVQARKKESPNAMSTARCV